MLLRNKTRQQMMGRDLEGYGKPQGNRNVNGIFHLSFLHEVLNVL